MSLQSGWDKTSQANGVTSIFGYNENDDATDSAIPWVFDDWFHGDFRTTRPNNLDDALRDKNPDLDEYNDSFPAWRINSVIEIGFNTPDGQTIPSGEWEVVMEESEQAPITLEAYPDSSKGNPFRNEFDSYDDSEPGQYLGASEKGPHTAKERVEVQGVDGIRGSIIYGGSDEYLSKAKLQGELTALVSSPALLTPAFVSAYAAHVTTFYTFVDFVFMADGAKLVRMWDASRYPAHALYLDGIKVGQNEFIEGVQWSKDQYLGNEAFENFGREGNTVGLTPFDQLGSFGYRTGFDLGVGPHPVDFGRQGGNVFTADDIEKALPDPLFPSNIDSPV